MCPRWAALLGASAEGRSFFFFQAEDGIRDVAVTGVQTCALPISWSLTGSLNQARKDHAATLLLNGMVLVTGGAFATGIPLASAELYDPGIAITLSATGRKIGGINTSRLAWSGATSPNIDVNRHGVVIATVPNTGKYNDSTGTTGRESFTYKVCEAGTQSCSNEVTVRFRR